MTTQNIILVLPSDLLSKAQLLAVRQDMSVYDLIVGELARLVAEDEAYGHARQSHLARLESAPDLSTEGRIDASRDELHK